MRRVGDNCLDRNVVSENFVIRIENRAALGVDGLLIDVFFGGEPGVLVVLDHLQVNEAERKKAEQRDEDETNQRAAKSSVPAHGRTCSFTTGWIASSPAEGGGMLRRTMLCSAIGTILM